MLCAIISLASFAVGLYIGLHIRNKKVKLHGNLTIRDMGKIRLPDGSPRDWWKTGDQ